MEQEYRYLCSVIAIAEIMERSVSEFDLLILIYWFLGSSIDILIDVI